jgi:phosphoglycerol transferase MdoB-like AlkP superfamily enzyme
MSPHEEKLADLNPNSNPVKHGILVQVGRFLFIRSWTVIIFAALFFTVSVKFFHAGRLGLYEEFFRWILNDVSVLLTIDVVLTAMCFRFCSKAAVRVALVTAAIVCTWSVMNAAWIIRTGTQILPAVLLQLVRTPVNTLSIVGVSLAKMPFAAVMLLLPSAFLITFFIYALSRVPLQNHDTRLFAMRTYILLTAVMTCFAAHFIPARAETAVVSDSLRFNSQLRAVTSLFHQSVQKTLATETPAAGRQIPFGDQADIKPLANGRAVNHNVVVVVLEGIQHRCTSMADADSNLTPHMAEIARQGAEFTNTRCVVTHTTKALFGILTGRFPSVSQDFVEAVPAPKPYASLATILRAELGFRTAFIQSAKGNFEARPGLVYNLGFDDFFAREDFNDPNCYIGYLSADEFKMIEPIRQWIKADSSPFFLTVLCSVSHDPYEVPAWFEEPAEEPFDRYRQTIRYTDKFIEALDGEVQKLGLADNTIFCIIGDHGEAFAEHGLLGHERIVFDEVLKVPWVIRAKNLITPATRVERAVNSVDFTPTLLSLLNYDVTSAGFDGIDALSSQIVSRNIYFACWMQGGPAGFVRNGKKYLYFPETDSVGVYDIDNDPVESALTRLDDEQGSAIAAAISDWRDSSFLEPIEQTLQKKILFDKWNCGWNSRVPWAKYEAAQSN